MNTLAPASSEFHLIAVHSPGRPAADSPPVPFIVPPGVSQLGWNHASEVALRSSSGATLDSVPRLEPLLSRPHEPRLLLASPPRLTVSINGLPAPRLALLAGEDRFHFDPGPSFRVALYHRPRLGPAPSEVNGVACPVCTLAVTEGDRCLVCACGTPLHAAEDETREGALGCAKLVTHCPHCQQPVRLVPGYSELSQPDRE